MQVELLYGVKGGGIQEIQSFELDGEGGHKEYGIVRKYAIRSYSLD